MATDTCSPPRSTCGSSTSATTWARSAPPCSGWLEEVVPADAIQQMIDATEAGGVDIQRRWMAERYKVGLGRRTGRRNMAAPTSASSTRSSWPRSLRAAARRSIRPSLFRSTICREPCWPGAPRSRNAAICPAFRPATSGARASRTRRRIGPCFAAHQGRAAGRPLCGQRAEDLVVDGDVRAVVHPAHPDRSRRPQAQGHFLLPVGHALAGRGGEADPADQRPLRIRRDLPHRRERFRGESGRAGKSRLGSGAGDAPHRSAA